LGGIIPPLIIMLGIPLISGIWPEFQEQIGTFADLLDNPVYEGFMGQLSFLNIGVWSGFYFMYIFTWIEMILVFITITRPVRLITNEVDKKTLDFILSYPIPRWQYLLEKFSGYLFFNLLYPTLLLLVSYISTVSLGEEMPYDILAYALIGTWCLFFALGALSLLCEVIFLESRKSLAAAAGIIISQWLFVRIGGLVDSLEFLQTISLFNYMNANTIYNLGSFPVDEFFIVIGVGIVALVGALIIFEKRDLTY
ncbi:hypothetical protein EU523_01000, partial [Candidatus Heimdallarchaeota archaeon]